MEGNELNIKPPFGKDINSLQPETINLTRKEVCKYRENHLFNNISC
jgi:hypothetical protein